VLKTCSFPVKKNIGPEKRKNESKKKYPVYPQEAYKNEKHIFSPGEDCTEKRREPANISLCKFIILTKDAIRETNTKKEVKLTTEGAPHTSSANPHTKEFAKSKEKTQRKR
jgi:hypothetical protein